MRLEDVCITSIISIKAVVALPNQFCRRFSKFFSTSENLVDCKFEVELLSNLGMFSEMLDAGPLAASGGCQLHQRYRSASPTFDRPSSKLMRRSCVHPQTLRRINSEDSS
jgi:hypothetical protein